MKSIPRLEEGVVCFGLKPPATGNETEKQFRLPITPRYWRRVNKALQYLQAAVYHKLFYTQIQSMGVC